METNKYYTPELEEFHVGFEYEIKRYFSKTIKEIQLKELKNFIEQEDEKGNFDWMKKTWSSTSSFLHTMSVTNDGDGNIVSITVPECIRVKHLDKEDIESLGFDTDITKGFQKPQLLIMETSKKGIIKGYFRIVFNVLNNSCNISDCCDDCLFDGKIKNKAELKKLLMQLEIL